MKLRAFAALALCAAAPVHAAGMTSHAMMADYGRQALPDGPLRQILTAHRPALLAGAIYPDGGYGSSAAFPEDRDMAEHAHWGEFHIAFVRYLREIGCGAQAARLVNLPAPVALPGATVTNPVGTFDVAGLTNECGQLIAFAFGDAAHGITDETWDAQFEPEVRDRHEDPNIGHWMDAGGFWGPITPGSVLRTIFGAQYGRLFDVWAQTPMNAIEYAMDVIAIVEHDLALSSPALVFPPADRLIQVYARSGKTVRREQIERGNAFSRGAVQIQAMTANLDYQRVRAHMPWSADNYFLSPGGIVPSGYEVAAMYQNMWQMLVGETPEFGVSGHFPAAGASGVRLRPATGSWTQHRWIHVFFNAEVDPASIEQPGAFLLQDRNGKRIEGYAVEGGHGWSRSWSHSTRVRLDAPLRPGERYTATLTSKVKDWSGRPLPRTYSWQFVTAAN